GVRRPRRRLRERAAALPRPGRRLRDDVGLCAGRGDRPRRRHRRRYRRLATPPAPLYRVGAARRLLVRTARLAAAIAAPRGVRRGWPQRGAAGGDPVRRRAPRPDRARSLAPARRSADPDPDLPLKRPMSLSGHDIHMSLKPLPGAEAELAELAAQARRDLAALAHPAAEWVRPLPEIAGRDVRDVVIVGADQAGLAVGFPLKRKGVHDVLLLDRNPAGYEGPWDTFARMEVLRTPKTLVGAELGIPSLSAKSWFEAVYGAEAWEQITWIPRRDWMRYLRWYRTIAALDIRNDIEVPGIAPEGRLLRIKTGDGPVLARRIVICTGHDAGGQWAVAEMVSEALPEQGYAHSNGPVDFGAIKGLRIRIRGPGGSAFDAVLTALAAGAASVDLCFRRARLPVVNPHRWLEWSAFLAHYHDLDDRTRWNVGRYFDIKGQPPPRH